MDTMDIDIACPDCGSIFRLDMAKSRPAPDQAAKTRSDIQHNLVFHALNIVADNWPTSHRYQPPPGTNKYTARNLIRGWLTVAAGYGIEVEYFAKDGVSVAAIVDVLTQSKNLITEQSTGYAAFIQYRDRCKVVRPQSLSYKEMDKATFQAFSTALFETIHAETGMTVRDIKSNTREPA